MQHLIAIPAFVSFYDHVIDAATKQKPFAMGQSHNLLRSLSAIATRFWGHSGDFGNAAKMVGKMSKSVMQLISIGF